MQFVMHYKIDLKEKIMFKSDLKFRNGSCD